MYYCSSFSKTISPGLRIGWIVSPEGDHQANLAKLLNNIAANTLEQIALSDYLQSGAYDRHLRDQRTHYTRNASSILADVLHYFPQGTRSSHPQGGITLWIQLPQGVDSLQLTEQCLAGGIGIFPGQVFSVSGRYNNCMRLSCALPYDKKVSQALKQIGNLAAEQL